MAGYIKQSEIRPIMAKRYLLDNWERYNVVDNKKDFIALLNILQACGETLDSLHDAYVNGDIEFCDIFHGRSFESDREVAEVLFEFCVFYTEQEFIDMILDRSEDFETTDEWSDAILRETSDDPLEGNNDCQISRTEDGYVRRIWC